MSAAAAQKSTASALSPEMAEHLHALIRTIRFCHERGWTPATSSNFSCRDAEADTTFYISASGLDKGEMDVRDFIALDWRTDRPELLHEPPPGRKPSAETLLHALIYRRYPEANAVLHCHSVNGTVLSKLYEDAGGIWFENYEILKAFEGIRTHETAIRLPVFPNDQDMARLSAVVEAELSRIDRQLPEEDTTGKPYGFLLAGHGLYAWGETIAQARRHLEAFEFLFEATLKLRLYGDPDHSR